ncbi:MAG TPA: hypothetical protein VI932_07915 [Bacteroidota bacterium]|nr:hypothetical protein [Bacteroidota bacterium]
MQTLFRLFIEYQTVAIYTAAILLMASVVPLTGTKFPKFLLLLISSPFNIVAASFGVWRKHLISLATKSRRRPGEGDIGPSSLTRWLMPVMQCLLVLGGIFILTTGVLSGYRASRMDGNGGEIKAMLETELPILARALRDTRTRIESLDREWAGIGERHGGENRERFITAINAIEAENARLDKFLSLDLETGEAFSDFKNSPAGVVPTGDIIRTLESFLPSLQLAEGKGSFLVRYFENCRVQEDLARKINGPPDPPVRTDRQPDYESLRRLEAELPPAIARIESDLKTPEPERRFNIAAFLEAFYPALIVFCAFILAIGHLIEVMSVSAPVTAAHSDNKGSGTLIWAE